jgi:serine protease Do
MPRTSAALLLVLAVPFALPGVAQPPKKAEPAAAAKPWFVDDEKLFDEFMEKLTDLAKDGKCLAHDKLVAKMKPGAKARLAPAKPGDKALSPEEVYKLSLPSVFVVGSVYKDKDGDWQDGLYATAWVAAPDGVLVTNWHVFEDLEPGEVFGALDYEGNVYPVTDFLGGDKVADVAVFRIDAKGLTPLAIADGHAEIGSWVGVLSHPGDNFFVFTTGSVTRYSTNKNDDGKQEKWMGLTAEYAGGSSGAPILNKYGAVVGMAALTLTVDDGGGVVNPPARKRLLLGQPPKSRNAKRQPPVAPPPREKRDPKDPPKPEPAPPATVQMILKMGVPGPTILRSFAK